MFSGVGNTKLLALALHVIVPQDRILTHRFQIIIIALTHVHPLLLQVIDYMYCNSLLLTNAYGIAQDVRYFETGLFSGLRLVATGITCERKKASGPLPIK